MFWVLLATLPHRFAGFHEPSDEGPGFYLKAQFSRAPKKTLKKCFPVPSEEVSSLGT